MNGTGGHNHNGKKGGATIISVIATDSRLKTFTAKITQTLFCMLALSGCFLHDGPRPGGSYALPPMENIPDNELAHPPVKNGQCIDPAPSLPDTDCTTWSHLHSLVVITSGMGQPVELSDEQINRLESEIYPLFVQTQLNCGQWSKLHDDYEPLSDILSMMVFLGVDAYDYDPAGLLESLLRGGAGEAFAQNSQEKGCVKSLFLLFVSYDGE